MTLHSDGVPERKELFMNTFFEKRFTRKVCVKFFPRLDNPSVCTGCQYNFEHHHLYQPSQEWSRAAKTWRSELHLELFECKLIRTLTFINEIENLQRLAHFCILSNDTHPQIVLKLLLKNWNIQRPDIIVSVTGSTRNISFTQSQFEKLQSGLLRTVNPTKSWIITGGTALGVDKVVCEVMRSQQYHEWMSKKPASFNIIGMANWNCVDQNEDIMQSIINESHYTYEIVPPKRVKDTQAEFMPPLSDINSHFVFIEGGIRGKWGQDIKVRSAVEHYLSIPKSQDGIGGEGIPLVLLILGGEHDTFERSANALEQNIPIVICKGTGGAADIIAKSLLYSKSGRLHECHVLDIEKKMEKMRKFKHQDGTFETSKHMHFIMKCLRKRSLIHIFDFDGKQCSRLEEVLMTALLSASASRSKNPLELAMAWNRCDDVIINIILKQIGDADHAIHTLPRIEFFLTEALMQNKIDFVELFLNLGFKLNLFLTRPKLLMLYKHTFQICAALQHLCLRYNLNYTHLSIEALYNLIFKVTGIKLSDSGNTFNDPFRELSVWAVLSNRWKLSYFFWNHTHNYMLLALLVSKLWTSMANSLPFGEMDERFLLVQNSEFMLNCALSILKTSFRTHKTLTHLLLLKRHENYKNINLIEAAGIIEAKHFIAHDSFQHTLAHIWKSGLRTSVFHTTMCFFFPTRIKFIKMDEYSGNQFADINWCKEFPINENHMYQLSDCKNPSFSRKLKLFSSAPITKFSLYLYIYMILLFSFSVYYCRYFSNDNKFIAVECMFFIVILSNVLEEIRQLLKDDSYMLLKMRLLLHSEWKVLEYCYLNLYLCGFAIRMIDLYYLKTTVIFEIVNIFYGFVCLLLWLNLLSFYRCVEHLGYICILIRKMLIETLYFMMFFVVVTLVFALSAEVLLSRIHNMTPYNKCLAVNYRKDLIFLKMYFLAFDKGIRRCMFGSTALRIVIALWVSFGFFIFTLLIAKYQTVFNEVTANSIIEWRTEILYLVQDFKDKFLLPPPLSFIQLLCTKLSSKRSSSSSISSIEVLSTFESLAHNYFIKSHNSSNKDKIDCINKEVLTLHKKLDESMLRIKGFTSALNLDRKKLRQKFK